MNTIKFKQEISQAVKQVAEKYGVNVRINKIEKANDHMESVLMITKAREANVVVATKKTPLAQSRRQQVAKFYNKGIFSAKVIAEKIGSHPSYVARFIHDLKVAS